MDPKLFAILTVFVIGIISFIIGWFLTSNRWKTKYQEELDKLQNLKTKNTRLTVALSESRQQHLESKNQLQLLHADLRVLEKNEKQLRKDNTYLKTKMKDQMKGQRTIVSPVRYASERSIQSIRKEIPSPAIKAPSEKAVIPLDKEKGVPKSAAIFHSSLDSILHRISIFSNPSQKDDLKNINGINDKIAKQLKAAGFYSYRQISMLSSKDIEEVSKYLGLPKNQAIDDAWVEQGRKLYDEKYKE